MKKTVVFDFDGVIHSYKSGWRGVEVIPDEPVPGIQEAIENIRAAGFEVVVVSSRCNQPEGIKAIKFWLFKYGIKVDNITAEKPPAVAYVDDRAICFDGDPGSLLIKINDFVPWYEKDTKSKVGGVTEEQIIKGLECCINDSCDRFEDYDYRKG